MGEQIASNMDAMYRKLYPIWNLAGRLCLFVYVTENALGD